MGFYFKDSESAAALYGSEPESVIRLMADRYMRDHPSAPFVWRTWNETGIQCDRKARYIFDFGRRFPDAEIGMVSYACGDLFCPKARQSRFVVTCSGPLAVWLNGEMLFRSNGTQERDETPCVIEVRLREGFNRFLLRCECTAIGFGCTLQNAMPQWEPCNYVLPFSERGGEAGFLYTVPMAADDGFAERVWNDQEAKTGIRWLPEQPSELKEEGNFYGWAKWECAQEPSRLPGELILLDDLPVRKGMKITAGVHDVLFFGPLPAIRRAAAGLPGKLLSSERILGSEDPMLVLGPCAETAENPASLKRLGILYENRTWRPDKAHMALRPYAEAELFGRWTYPLGVTLYGLLSAGRALEEQLWIDYVHRHVRQAADIQPYALWDQSRWGFPGVNQQLCWLDALDDCGSFASVMLECDPRGEVSSIRGIALRVGEYMLREQPRTRDGAFRRRDDTVWADDMYMSGPFLCRYAAITGQQAPLDDYAAQQLKYRELLFLPEKKVMAHMMCLRHGKNNGIPWSRGNGWVIFSLSELLMRLDPAHPLYDALIRHFNDLTEGYLSLQDGTGLWHQILDEPATYPETSAAGMFVCAFCRGVLNGWYPKALSLRAKQAVLRAWRGLTEQAVDRDGNLYGVCRGSGFSFSRAYYRTLSWNYNDTHGIGIVMLAGTEIMRLKEAG